MNAQQQFAARIAELIAQAREIPEAAARRVIAELERARAEVTGRLAAAPARSFSESHLRMLLAENERVLREFRDRATGHIQRGQEQGWTIGARIAEEPLAAIHVRPLLAQLSRTQLVVAQGYSASLVRGLSSRARTELDGILRRSLLGGQSLDEVLNQVGRAITGKTPSVFSKAAGQALRVTRTEVPRMISVATQARQEQMAERVPELGKEWMHSPQEHPRLSHLQLDGTVVKVRASFRAPSGVRLMYPRDPSAPASETVNCACSVAPHVPPALLRAA